MKDNILFFRKWNYFVSLIQMIDNFCNEKKWDKNDYK